MIGVIMHPVLLRDHRGDPFRRPDVAQEPVGFGSPGQQRGELRPLVRGQPGRGPGRRFGAQRVLASFAQPFEPLTDRSRAHPERCRDLLPGPAFLMELGCSEPEIGRAHV